MMYIKRSVAFAACLFITITTAFSQETFKPTYEVGIAAGTFIYQGDLTPSYLGSYKVLQPNITIYGSRSISPTLAVRVNIASGKMSANEGDYNTPSWRQQRNFSFSTSLTEVSGLLIWNPFRKNEDMINSKFQIYAMAGAGIAFLDGSRNWHNMTTAYVDQNPAVLTALGYDTVHSMNKPIVVLPIGAGIKYALGNNFSIFGEALYRITFSDYIDGFSYAANPKNKDAYYSLSVGISYTFNRSRVSCPKDVR
jgi:Domain of unknown function (DUF6089)